MLRETAQTPKEDLAALQDISRHRYVNTNNLWIDLQALDSIMREREGVLGLPLIVNRKTVDPGDSSTPEVFQLETAMGAAIGVFDGAQPVRVPRRRFSPVKTTEDLLALRSDAYVLADDARVELASARDGTPPIVDLDSAHYKLLRDFDARFPGGAPSLVGMRAARGRGRRDVRPRRRRPRDRDGARAAADRGRRGPRGVTAGARRRISCRPSVNKERAHDRHP